MSPSQPEELRQISFRDVLELVLSGHREARDELFARLASETSEGALLLAVVRRLMPAGDGMRDFVETRDLIQSALRSGWLNFSEFRGATPGEFLSWMRTILRRKIVRAIRDAQERRRRGDPNRKELRARTRSVELPIAMLIREEAQARARRAVDDLPEDQRIVLEMRLEGMNATEIADRLGLQPAAVRKRESRALARLRQALAPPDRDRP